MFLYTSTYVGAITNIINRMMTITNTTNSFNERSLLIVYNISQHVLYSQYRILNEI